ncbi:MAG TPA: hypothetical protein VI958_05745 [Acidobacteriota bacterium]
MKKFLFFLFLVIPAVSQAQQQYPWSLTLFGGGAALCDEQGCFGPTGWAAGGSFGRHMTDRWAFELDVAIARTNELLPPRVDQFGNFFIPELQRTRGWGGGTFLATLGHIGSESDFFVGLGIVGVFERREEITPPDVFHEPARNLGLKGGIAGSAGMNLWLSKNWGIRPEAKFYLTAGSLSGVRYTAGLLRKFD